jgi:hypothetical protein
MTHVVAGGDLSLELCSTTLENDGWCSTGTQVRGRAVTTPSLMSQEGHLTPIAMAQGVRVLRQGPP